ncbi:hypothetical protein Mal15_06470 [Stieleria maiorica]|uniref:Ice-binding protein C-terminal domain-containing protein n=1 Tax=Stieleria maiorica TaxID=2795974 RepID=A0A5B9M7C2_9BACT|nr:PEP-CTERM sorting domain-containing protein [Stieleria maiorica]QEF96619.1 hypothetical protein Mal15_06470 [Stieleria maiorica]
MKLASTLLLASLVFALINPVAARAAVVTNGSFEIPDIPDTSAFDFFLPGQTIDVGWVVDSASASAVLVTRASPPTALDGDQSLIMGTAPDVATIWQDLTLDADSYQLSFQLATADLSDDASVRIDIVRGVNSILGGGSVFDVPTGSGFVTKTMNFNTSSADTYRLIVRGENGSPAVDAFSIQQITAIPEPSSLLVLAAIGTAAVTRRRRWSSA